MKSQDTLDQVGHSDVGRAVCSACRYLVFLLAFSITGCAERNDQDADKQQSTAARSRGLTTSGFGDEARRSGQQAAAGNQPSASRGSSPINETPAAQVEEPPLEPLPEKPIDDFSLVDVYGREHALEDHLAGNRLLVVAFLGTECPLAQLYTPRLHELFEEYAPQGVGFVAINSNRQDSLSDMRANVEEHDLRFSLLKDPDGAIAEMFEARRTPQVFLLDEDRRIRYCGCIDDEYGFHRGATYHRERLVQTFLADAIDALLGDGEISRPRTRPVGCLIARRREPSGDGTITWSRHIAKIFASSCQPCHRPNQTAPFSLLTYEDVGGWEDMILEVIDQGRMPPWHADPEFGQFANDPRLSNEQCELIRDWIEHGTPLGEVAEIPPPRKFDDGWRIKDPDLVLHIAEEPVEVPAVGRPEFRYFVIDLGLTEGRWATEIESRPDNLSVVHHMDSLAAPPGDFEELLRMGEVTRLSGYVPGLHLIGAPPDGAEDVTQGNVDSSGTSSQTVSKPEFRDGPRASDVDAPSDGDVEEGIYLSAGAQVAIEMHYKPNGRPQLDHSSVAFKFADSPGGSAPHSEILEPGAKEQLAAPTPADPPLQPDDSTASETTEQKSEYWGPQVSVLIESTDFCIPPNDPFYPIDAWYVFQVDSLLVSLHAHMHVRGRAMRFDAHYPDGTIETLLNVPNFDYSWQHVYMLAEPKRIPKGTRLHVRSHFDNSAENPNNPESDLPVVYGRGYYDEEMTAGGIIYHPLLSEGELPVDQIVRTLAQGIKPLIPDARQALVGYTSSRQVLPENLHRFYHLRGQFREFHNDLDGAVRDYSLAIASQVNFFDAYVSRGMAYVKSGQPQQAANDFSEAIRIDSSRAEPYLLRAHLWPTLADAMPDLDQALAIQPRNAAALYHRASRKAERGDVPGALADLRRVTDEVHPGHTDSYLLRAKIHLREGQNELAARDYETVLDRWPTRKTKVDYAQGSTLYELGRFAEAEPYLTAFARVVPDHVGGHRMLAVTLMNLGRNADAAEHLAEASRVAGGNVELSRLHALALQRIAEGSDDPTERAAKFDSAISRLETLHERLPQDAQIELDLAGVCFAAGDVPRAIRHYRAVLTRQPNELRAVNSLAWIYATSSETDEADSPEALELALRACRATKFSVASYLDTLAAAYANEGRFADALATIDQAIELSQKSGDSSQAEVYRERRETYQNRRPYRLAQ